MDINPRKVECCNQEAGYLDELALAGTLTNTGRPVTIQEVVCEYIYEQNPGEYLYCDFARATPLEKVGAGAIIDVRLPIRHKPLKITSLLATDTTGKRYAARRGAWEAYNADAFRSERFAKLAARR
jgi:hypothetical protein